MSALRVAPSSNAVLQALLRAAPDRPLGVDESYCAAVTLPSAPARPIMSGDWWVRAEYDGLIWLLVESADTSPLDHALAGDVPAGVGLPRRGVEGAGRSLVDARQVFALSTPASGPVHFAKEWVAATVLAQGESLEELCAEAIEVARRYPHLSDAVRAFAEQGLSVVGAARALHVHANTVIYRLERWHRLTGWDARTFAGLSRSMAALAAARAEVPGQSGRAQGGRP